MGQIYKNIDEYNSSKKEKKLIALADMIAYMICKKNLT